MALDPVYPAAVFLYLPQIGNNPRHHYWLQRKRQREQAPDHAWLVYSDIQKWTPKTGQ